VIVFCIAGFELINSNPAYAGAGSIPEFSVSNQLGVHIRVSCPGNVGFTWQVAVDNWNNIVYEEGSQGKDFTINGSQISNGHHNALARVRCNGEDWSNATTSTVGFDWYGGNPTPIPPPPGYEVAISINVQYGILPEYTPNGMTVSAACSNTTVRAVRILVNGQIVYELGSPVVTYTWPGGSAGIYVFSAMAACNGDDNWKTVAGASVTVTVQAGADPGEGGEELPPINPPPPPIIVVGDAPTIPEAQQPDTPGGFDLIKVAYHYGFADVRNFDDTAGGWYWIKSNGDRVAIDFSQVCRDVYGSRYRASKINNSAGGWRCVQGSAQGGGSNPVVVPTDCSDKLTPRLTVNGKARVVSGIEYITLRPSFQSGDVLMRLAPGTTMDILAGPKCGQNNYWYEVRTSDGTKGWLPEGRTNAGYWLEPVQETAEKVTPVVVPLDSDFVCDDSEKGAGETNNRPQCVELIRQQYPQLTESCPGVSGPAYKWAEKVRDNKDPNCPLTINPTISPIMSIPLDWNNIRPGDIVVWDKACGTKPDQANLLYGHIAIVGNVLLPKTKDAIPLVLVWEWNWGDDKVPHAHRIWPSCMSFIRTPWKPKLIGGE